MRRIVKLLSIGLGDMQKTAADECGLTNARYP